MRLWRNDWRGAGFPLAFGKWFDNGNYVLHFDGSRVLFEWVPTVGGAVALLGPSLRRAGPQPIWLRATLKVAAPYQARIYYSDDGADWRIIAERNGGALEGTSIRTSAVPLLAGIELNGGLFAQPLNGAVFYAEVRHGIEGPVVARFDPSEADGPGDGAWVSSTGEAWTARSAPEVVAF